MSPGTTEGQLSRALGKVTWSEKARRWGRAGQGRRAHPKCAPGLLRRGEGLQLLWKHLPELDALAGVPLPHSGPALPLPHGTPGGRRAPRLPPNIRAPSRVFSTSPSRTPSSPQQATPHTKRRPSTVLVSGSLSWGGVSDGGGPFPRVLKASHPRKRQTPRGCPPGTRTRPGQVSPRDNKDFAPGFRGEPSESLDFLGKGSISRSWAVPWNTPGSC